MLSLDSILNVDPNSIPKAFTPRGDCASFLSTDSMEEEEYCREFDNSSIPRPSDEEIELFISGQSDILTSSSLISSGNARSVYELNWLNTNDYISHWDLLPHSTQLSIRKLILADNKTNRNRFGLKRKNLESHFLLASGCELSNIISGKHDPILTNLKSPDGNYSGFCVENRALDPKTCLRAYNKFQREYNLELLFTNGYQAYQCVISPNEPFKITDNIYESREKFKGFFKRSLDYVSKLAHKKNRISSYLYSNEVSVDSILEGKYRPHTHLVIFLPRENKETQIERVLEIEAEFNNHFSDRRIRFARDEKLDLPLRVSKLEKIENTICYLFRCYSLAETYLREISSSNIRELNLKTRETYYNLKEILNTDSSNLEKGVRRFNTSNIPRRGKEHLFKHRILQKRSASNRIKKEKTSKKKEMIKISTPQAAALRPKATAQIPANKGKQIPGMAPGLPGTLTVAPPAPKGFPAPTKPLPGDSRFVGPLLPYQQDPGYQAYEGFRASADELNRAGIGLEDFMGGGGRFSIYEKPKVAPVESGTMIPAGTGTLGKKGSCLTILEEIRRDLEKGASEFGDDFPYSWEKIESITESPESFANALHKEAAAVWEGISEVLQKEAQCDKDFLLGVIKEAEEHLEKVADLALAQKAPAQQGNMPPGESPGSSGTLPEDRHRILKFLPNKYTGLGSGALLGTLLSNRLGLRGPLSWLPVALGAAAGHHFLPKIMNAFKDPLGSGVNKLHPVSSSISKSLPYSGKGETWTGQDVERPQLGESPDLIAQKNKPEQASV